MKRRSRRNLNRNLYLLTGVASLLLAVILVRPRPAASPVSINLIDSGAETVMTDNFSIDSGFSKKISGLAKYATYQVENDVLSLIQQPRNFYNSIGLSKTYSYDLSKPTWFHIKWKFDKYLLGEDMYSTLTFYQNNDPAKALNLTVGVNSEQHWLTNYFYGAKLPACQEKINDDEFFISVSSDLFPGAPDTRLRYPSGYKKKYTDWTVFSILYTPPASARGQGSFAFYVDGRLVDNLHPIDDPGATIVPQTTALNGLGKTTIKFTAESLTDGVEHAYTGNKYGTRGRGCYAAMSPAKPSVLAYPAKFEGNDGSRFKAKWMKDYDKVATIMVESMKDVMRSKQEPWAPYQIPKSALSPMPADQTGAMHPVDMYQYLRTYFYPSQDVKNTASKAIWNGIYNGTVDLETAIYMGAIELPPETHQQWNYVPAGSRNKIAEKLNRLKTNYPGPLARAYVWDQLYSIGGTIDLVHFGYLTPEEVRDAGVLKYLTSAEKAAIPEKSVPEAGIIKWDYFRIDREPPQLD